MHNKDWKAALIKKNSSILQAMRAIDKSSAQIGFIVDEDDRLFGIVTDGDIRRHIINGLSLQNPVTEVMNTHPVVCSIADRPSDILALMKQKDIKAIPIVNEDQRIVRIDFFDQLIAGGYQESCVVLMAGGMGTRLSPLTDSCPKPLLRVGNKPVLETILDQFIKCGFRRFFLSVNYRSEMVMDYFGDGSRWGIEISYLEEKSRLGTAGSLSLLPFTPENPFFVMNGDVLTNTNFEAMLGHHYRFGKLATMGVRPYEFQVPYGVVHVENDTITKISEKPTHKFYINAGIYVLEPRVLEVIEPNTYLDMPTLFSKLINSQLDTTVFPIKDYWVDIGGHEELQRAQSEFSGVFG